MRIHILGICGTFMAGLAIIAKQLGHEVSGSDENVYPPMSTQLQNEGISLMQGFDPMHLHPVPDLVIIGNAMKRGNPAVEYVLNYNLPYSSGPEWLFDHVLKDRWVLAVSGTHGKTTTASILAWLLEHAGFKPGFLIGGIPNNFSLSARLGESGFFIIEGDEYDSAFFDKRSKFLHYRPRTLIINNLEFDHADIFPNLAAIQQQFHYLIRTIPHNGLIVAPSNDENINQTLAQGCWTPIESFGDAAALWHAENCSDDGQHFFVNYNQHRFGEINWQMLGKHNVANALAAMAAAQHAGVTIEKSLAALPHFTGVKRRLEMKAQVQGVVIYDDFAHHPTAIAATIEALRARVKKARIIAVMEFGSYTMRHGVHGDKIVAALHHADYVLMLRPKEAAKWNIDDIAGELDVPARVCDDTARIIQNIISQVAFGDQVLIMSNKGFDNIHEKLIKALRATKIRELPQPFFVT